MFRNLFPGFGIALGAFSVYLAVDALTHPSNIAKLKEDAKRQKEGSSLKEALVGKADH